MNLAQRVLVNTVVQLAGRVLALALGLITLRLTTTYLGVEGFGQLSIIIALTALLATVADLGVVTTLAREVAKAPDKADQLGGNLLRFRIVSAIGVALIALAVIPLLPYAHATKVGLAIALVGMVFTVLSTFPVAYFQTNLRLDLRALVDVLTRLLGLLAIILVILLELGLTWLVSLLALAASIICLVSFALSRRFWRINVRFQRATARPLIKSSVGIGIVAAVGLLHFQGDAILLSLLKPAGDVGIYAVAFRFVDQAFLLPALFVATVFPIITRAIHRQTENAARVINTTFRMLVLGGIAMTILLFVLARPLVHLVASDAFDRSVEPLRILAFALIFIFVAPVFYNVLIAIDRQRDLLVIGVVGLCLNVALNLVLIPRYSYNGAAITTVISEAFVLATSYAVARRRYDFQLELGFVGRALGAAAPAAAVAAALHDASAWLAFALAETTFIALAYLLRAVTPADLKLVLERRPT